MSHKLYKKYKHHYLIFCGLQLTKFSKNSDYYFVFENRASAVNKSIKIINSKIVDFKLELESYQLKLDSAKTNPSSLFYQCYDPELNNQRS